MTIDAAIFLIAVGAILKFATNFHVQGVSIDTVGLILMIAGGVGLLLGLWQELIWSRRRPAPERWKNGAKSASRRATSSSKSGQAVIGEVPEPAPQTPTPEGRCP